MNSTTTSSNKRKRDYTVFTTIDGESADSYEHSIHLQTSEEMHKAKRLSLGKPWNVSDLQIATEIYPAILKPVLIRQLHGSDAIPFHLLPPFEGSVVDVSEQTDEAKQNNRESHVYYYFDILPGECDRASDRIKLIKTVRDQLDGWIESKTKQHHDMRDYLVDVAQKSYSGQPRITISMPKEKTSKMMQDLVMNDFKIYMPGPRFCREVSCKGSLGQPSITQKTINVTMGAHQDIDAFIEKFAKVTHEKAQIDAVWRLDLQDAGHNHGQWSGMLKVLVTYPRMLASWQRPDVDVICPPFNQVMPGYIRFDGEEIELQYLYRLPWCTRCKSNTQSFHTRDDCHRKHCEKCESTRQDNQSAAYRRDSWCSDLWDTESEAKIRNDDEAELAAERYL